MLPSPTRISTVDRKNSTVVTKNSTVDRKITTVFLLSSPYTCLCQKHPAHPAYPTLKVKNLTCGMSGIGGLFFHFTCKRVRERGQGGRYLIHIIPRRKRLYKKTSINLVAWPFICNFAPNSEQQNENKTKVFCVSDMAGGIGSDSRSPTDI